jgi:hypothetical protein
VGSSNTKTTELKVLEVEPSIVSDLQGNCPHVAIDRMDEMRLGETLRDLGSDKDSSTPPSFFKNTCWARKNSFSMGSPIREINQSKRLLLSSHGLHKKLRHLND